VPRKCFLDIVTKHFFSARIFYQATLFFFLKIKIKLKLVPKKKKSCVKKKKCGKKKIVLSLNQEKIFSASGKILWVRKMIQKKYLKKNRNKRRRKCYLANR